MGKIKDTLITGTRVSYEEFLQYIPSFTELQQQVSRLGMISDKSASCRPNSCYSGCSLTRVGRGCAGPCKLVCSFCRRIYIPSVRMLGWYCRLQIWPKKGNCYGYPDKLVWVSCPWLLSSLFWRQQIHPFALCQCLQWGLADPRSCPREFHTRIGCRPFCTFSTYMTG